MAVKKTAVDKKTTKKKEKKSASSIVEKVPQKDRTHERKFISHLMKNTVEAVPSGYPEDDMVSLAVEYCGLQATGKTHNGGTFPSPVLFDTEDKGWKVWKKLGHSKDTYYQGDSFEDVIAMVKKVINDPSIKTVVMDSSQDIDGWAEQLACVQLQRDRLFSDGGAVLYSYKYEKMDWIIFTLRDAGKNLVFTSRMKDEYVMKKKTGKLIPAGYKKAAYKFDIVIELTDIVEWQGDIWILDRIIGKVLKNGFVWKEHSVPYISDMTYEGIQKLMEPQEDVFKYMTGFLKEVGAEE